MYNLYENPKELKDARTIRHLTDSLIVVLECSYNEKLVKFTYLSLIATLDPIKDQAIIQKINNIYEQKLSKRP